jgi:hypothetical protein
MEGEGAQVSMWGIFPLPHQIFGHKEATKNQLF